MKRGGYSHTLDVPSEYPRRAVARSGRGGGEYELLFRLDCEAPVAGYP
jgi:hypothetical protein